MKTKQRVGIELEGKFMSHVREFYLVLSLLLNVCSFFCISGKQKLQRKLIFIHLKDNVKRNLQLEQVIPKALALASAKLSPCWPTICDALRKALRPRSKLGTKMSHVKLLWGHILPRLGFSMEFREMFSNHCRLLGEEHTKKITSYFLNFRYLFSEFHPREIIIHLILSRDSFGSRLPPFRRQHSRSISVTSHRSTWYFSNEDYRLDRRTGDLSFEAGCCLWTATLL